MATIKELEESVKKLNKEIEERVKKLHDDLAELKAKQNSGLWVPEQGEIYYYIYSDLSVVVDRNHNYQSDKNRILVGNCYKTEEDGEKERDRLIAIAEVNQIIREENGDWVPNWKNDGQTKKQIVFSYTTNCLACADCYTCKAESALEYCSVFAISSVMDRITRDQIDKIWRL